jgi:RNA polymerase sigma factor CnrH
MEMPAPRPESDRDAFDRFVRQYHGPIGRLVYRLLGWRDGGEDVVQDVFLSAWAAWSRFPGPAGAEPWLKRIAINKCRSRLRRDAVRARWQAWIRAVGIRSPEATCEERVEKEESASRVRRAIQSLEKRYRETTILYYLEQMDLDQIAQVTGQRRNTVEVQLHRARRKLEILLKDLME